MSGLLNVSDFLLNASRGAVVTPECFEWCRAQCVPHIADVANQPFMFLSCALFMIFFCLFVPDSWRGFRNTILVVAMLLICTFILFQVRNIV